MLSSISGLAFAHSFPFDPFASSTLGSNSSDAENAGARLSPLSASVFERSKGPHMHPCGPSHNSASFNKTLKRLSVQVEATDERRGQVSETSQTQSNAQSQLDLLEKLTSGREKGSLVKDPEKTTVAEQLATKISEDTSEASVLLGKKIPLEYDDLTVSQKRNIRRQQYLDQVSQRNDAPFFATVALFVILPPVVILGVAVATGYIDLLP